MLIGSRLLATAFKKIYQDVPSVYIYVSGVSNFTYGDVILLIPLYQT